MVHTGNRRVAEQCKERIKIIVESGTAVAVREVIMQEHVMRIIVKNKEQTSEGFDLSRNNRCREDEVQNTSGYHILEFEKGLGLSAVAHQGSIPCYH
jgi:hypothetical protein